MGHVDSFMMMGRTPFLLSNIFGKSITCGATDTDHLYREVEFKYLFVYQRWSISLGGTLTQS